MFKRCLICTNFEDKIDRFSHFVPDLAKAGFEKIVFYHNIDLAQEGIIPRGDSIHVKKAEEKLAPALSSIPEGVEVKIEVSYGQAATVIPRLVETYNIDLIIVASVVKNSLQDNIFGSTTEVIASSISVPLLIFRPQLLAVYTHEEMALRCQNLFRYLLVPYSDSDSGNYSIQRLKEILPNRKENSLEHCFLVSVVDDNSRDPLLTKQKLEQGTQKLASVKNELEQFSVKIESRVSVGVPMLEVLKTAYDEEISVIVIARANTGMIKEILAPSLAREFMHRSWFPLLFFSPKK